MPEQQPASPFERAFLRASVAAGLCWRAVDLPVVGPFVLLLLPFAVLVALFADLLAFLFGGFVRSVVTWTTLMALIGIVLGVIMGGDGLFVMPLMMAAVGLFLGLILGFLCGRIFRELPDFYDRQLSGK